MTNQERNQSGMQNDTQKQAGQGGDANRQGNNPQSNQASKPGGGQSAGQQQAGKSDQSKSDPSKIGERHDDNASRAPGRGDGGH